MKFILLSLAGLLISPGAFALQTLSNCGDAEALPLIQQLDTAEGRVNQLHTSIRQQLSRAQGQSQEARKPACDSANQSFTQFQQLGGQIMQKIQEALPALQALGATSCVNELKGDLQTFPQMQQTLKQQLGSTCGGAGSGGPLPPPNNGGTAR